MSFVHSNYGVVFIKSLKKTSTQEIIYSVFSEFGKIKFVELPFNKSKGKNIGYGYVIFRSLKVASRLLERFKELEVDGKMITILPFSEHSDCEGTPAIKVSTGQSKQNESVRESRKNLEEARMKSAKFEPHFKPYLRNRFFLRC